MFGSAELVLMRTPEKLMFSSMWRLNMWSLLDIIVQFVDIFVRPFLHIKDTSKENIDLKLF
jgi:hypothetical protein